MAPHISQQLATSRPERPKDVEEIVREAQNFDYNPLIPLKYWLRTAGTLLKEVCEALGNGGALGANQITGRDLRA